MLQNPKFVHIFARYYDVNTLFSLGLSMDNVVLNIG